MNHYEMSKSSLPRILKPLISAFRNYMLLIVATKSQSRITHDDEVLQNEQCAKKQFRSNLKKNNEVITQQVFEFEYKTSYETSMKLVINPFQISNSKDQIIDSSLRTQFVTSGGTSQNPLGGPDGNSTPGEISQYEQRVKLFAKFNKVGMLDFKVVLLTRADTSIAKTNRHFSPKTIETRLIFDIKSIERSSCFY